MFSIRPISPVSACMSALYLNLLLSCLCVAVCTYLNLLSCGMSAPSKFSFSCSCGSHLSQSSLLPSLCVCLHLINFLSCLCVYRTLIPTLLFFLSLCMSALTSISISSPCLWVCLHLPKPLSLSLCVQNVSKSSSPVLHVLHVSLILLLLFCVYVCTHSTSPVLCLFRPI
jgi:hypothetical protein